MPKTSVLMINRGFFKTEMIKLFENININL